MKTVTKSAYKRSLTLGLAFAAAIGVSSVGAASGVSILDDSILDYTGQAPTNEVSRCSNVDAFNSDEVLSEYYYDWSLNKLQGLEEAEFAAFEGPAVYD